MKKLLDSNIIKIIAIIAMSIDHITWMIYPGYPKEIIPIILHMIGRITCPIMCYFIAEGYHYTKDINKYTKRLFVFAFISHFAYVFASMDFVDWKSFIPFYYGSALNQTSVMWSLAWGLVMLRVVNSKKIESNMMKVLLIALAVSDHAIDTDTFPGEISTLVRLRVWFKLLREYVSRVREHYLLLFKIDLYSIKLNTAGGLKRIVRILANSNLWPQTRLALTVQT